LYHNLVIEASASPGGHLGRGLLGDRHIPSGTDHDSRRRVPDPPQPLRKAVPFLQKNQKTFTFGVLRADPARMPMSQSFCFFFQKEALLCFGSISINTA
jgi:hypothetical protein